MTSRDGTAIAFETAGTGSPVILVDGAMCFRGFGPMRAIAEQLRSDHTVLLYDRRGRGESGDTPPYALAREVEDVAALVARVGGPVQIFGMSSGGAVALHTATALGNSVSHVAVFDVPFMPAPALPAAAAYTEELTTALATDDRDAAVAAFLRRVGTPEPAIKHIRTSAGWPAMTAIAPTLRYDDLLVGGGVPASLAGSLDVPVLGLAGGESPGFLRHGSERIAALAPRGRFELIEGVGHDVPAERLAPRLHAFFGEQDDGE
ncbi:alpha/beta fold hydrolase [Lysobacter korlensis]|uniref:Alpha/beta fold hydrolase n=1 Tax=Lysobacter korlensis TaxID=553636 RepID=A0ABV6RW44_9GAMM